MSIEYSLAARSDATGRTVATGIYFVRMMVDGKETDRAKVLIMR